MSGLSERDMRILAFERRGWPSPSQKEQAIAEVLDLPATRYYQLLNELIDRPEHVRHVLVPFDRGERMRWRRVRCARRRLTSTGSNASASGRSISSFSSW